MDESAEPARKIGYYEARRSETNDGGQPEVIRVLIRFARVDESSPPVTCAECGTETRRLWTMLVPFHAHRPVGMMMKKGRELAALTLVCDDHPMWPTDAVLNVLQGGDEIEIPDDDPWARRAAEAEEDR